MRTDTAVMSLSERANERACGSPPRSPANGVWAETGIFAGEKQGSIRRTVLRQMGKSRIILFILLFFLVLLRWRHAGEKKNTFIARGFVFSVVIGDMMGRLKFPV